MKRVPFLIIEAAKQCDDEAVNFIRHHFEEQSAGLSLVCWSTGGAL